MNSCWNVPKNEVKETARIVQETMANAFPMRHPAFHRSALWKKLG